MSSIQRRMEAEKHIEPDYLGRNLSESDVASGRHRRWVGGKWDTMGKLQLDFLVAQGLQPDHRLVDVGCGSLRAGRILVDYLQPGNYYGIDINHSVLQAGYDRELSDDQRGRLPAENLRATDRFDIDFGVKFDMGIAQSVFTHMSLNHIRLCLYRVATMMRPGARFYATFFEQQRNFPVDGIRGKHRPGFGERNPYWYYRGDLRWAARFAPWEYRYIGDWDHPANQKMVEFTRLTD